MDLIDGVSLAECIRDKTLPFREAARLIQRPPMQRTMRISGGVLHRDLKPQNILLQGSQEGSGFGVQGSEQGSGFGFRVQ